MTTITITDDNGRSTTYRVDGEIKHCVDQFHSHGMFGINLTDRRRHQSIQSSFQFSMSIGIMQPPEHWTYSQVE